MHEMTMMNRTDLPFLVSGRAHFAAALAAGGYKPQGQVSLERSQELTTLREHLRDIAGFSTLGIKTLSGVSPKNAALEQLVQEVGEIHDSEEQVMAIDEILTESHKLYPDQNAYVIAKMIGHFMPDGEVALMDRARSRIGGRILRAGTVVAPELASENQVSDSAPLDLLKEAIVPFSQLGEFGFLASAQATLEEVGLLEPVADELFARTGDNSPQGLANWIGNQIEGMLTRQVTPQDLSLMLDHAVTLPDDLRGRSLALLANTFWNASRDPHNEAIITEIGQLIDELPIKLRITPLEASYNQLSLMRHEIARERALEIGQSIKRLPKMQCFRFNRSCGDLQANMRKLNAILDSADLYEGETLAHYDRRAQMEAVQQKRFAWAA